MASTKRNAQEFVTSLYSYEYTGEETESGSSDDEINLLISESSDSEVEDRPEPKKIPPAIEESITSESNMLKDQESDSEVINVIEKRKRNKRVLVLDSSDSDEIVEPIKKKKLTLIGDETPDSFHVNENDLCEIVIEK